MDGLPSGQAVNFQYEARFIREDGIVVWWDVSVGVQCDAAADPAYLIYVIRDVTDRKAAQEHQRFLMHELSHRTKNQLAIVSAIARQTARTAGSMKDFRALIEQRLHGLSVSVDLLVKQGWSGTPLRELIEKQLEAFKAGNDRLRCEGPEVSLDSFQAEAIGLALHELSTNCLKYGAWSTSEGTVSVFWELDPSREQRLLCLKWVERGGPPVSKPKHTGFGQTVIKDLLTQKLGAEVELAYLAEGVEWTLCFRLPGDPPGRTNNFFARSSD